MGKQVLKTRDRYGICYQKYYPAIKSEIAAALVAQPYQVPVEVPPQVGMSLALRWLVDAARSQKWKIDAEKLAAEMSDAAKGQGNAAKSVKIRTRWPMPTAHLPLPVVIKENLH